jgi:hypothetical protein
MGVVNWSRGRKKNTFQGLQGNDKLFILELVSVVEERARYETREGEDNPQA